MSLRGEFNGRNVLVTGGTGLIGQPLVRRLLNAGAKVRIVSLDSPRLAPPGVEFLRLDLTHIENAHTAVHNMQDVFHLAGIKGSPAMASQRPASFMYSTLAFNTAMIHAACEAGVERFLYTSSIGVYAPADVMKEDSVWSTFPSPHDRFAGWAKRMGELLLEAHRIEHQWNQVYCVRPANVYGPYDNFDPANAMVIPSLISRALGGESPFVVWGDGSAVRDFLFSEDCAQGMLQVMQKDIREPVNLGSGEGVSIRQLVETLINLLPHHPEVRWDTTRPSGDKCRILDTSLAQSHGISPKTTLQDGLMKTVEWYSGHRAFSEDRHNVFA